jgi:hypothetical protein
MSLSKAHGSARQDPEAWSQRIHAMKCCGVGFGEVLHSSLVIVPLATSRSSPRAYWLPTSPNPCPSSSRPPHHAHIRDGGDAAAGLRETRFVIPVTNPGFLLLRVSFGFLRTA